MSAISIEIKNYRMMNPRVVSVTATDDYKLNLTFSNGEFGIYNCSHLLNFGVLRKLQDKNYFKQVNVLDGTVVWPNEQDICPDTLYLESQKMPIAVLNQNETIQNHLRSYLVN